MKVDDIKKLLAQLSLEEKIGELFQLPSYFFDGDNVTGPAAELGITSSDLCVAGSCLSVTGAKKLHEIQQNHMQKHPHHIPMLFMADIINGYHTIFPIPLAQGATFNPDLVEKGASIAAREAAAAGIHVTFSPMADLSQDARWGRVMESTGEDSFLNGKMAVSMIRGYQGSENDLSQKGKLAACLKHFAGYGSPEGGRDYNTVEISERTLRDEYFPAYQDAINAGCALVMTSFNTLNRIPSSGNCWLMRDVLQKEMGFEGVLISDWNAIGELMIHGIAADENEAAKLALQAGVDIDMASPIYLKHLKKLLEEGIITEQMIDECTLRVLLLKNKLGLFENPYKDADEEDEKSVIRCKEHLDAARACAEESFVLLKNKENFFPLQKDKDSIAFIGPYVDNRLLSGSWSFFGDDADCITLKDALQAHDLGKTIRFATGSSLVNPGINILGFQKTPPKEIIDTDEKLTTAINEAVTLAKEVDKVVLCLGEPRDYSGEGASRSDITLPACQIRLLREIAKVNENISVVLFNGRPLDLRDVDQFAKAILEVWFPGTEGAEAIIRVLFGDCAPSGKLPMSFPYCVGQVPIHYNHLNTGRPFYGDFRKERYASQYLDVPVEPLYPFGYGLTYTTFSCSSIELNKQTFSAGEEIQASVLVTNNGYREGSEVVQMYIHDVAASVARPVRELKGFEKITLKPGESQKITFRINENLLRFYDINMNYTSEPGKFEIFIGFDSTTTNKTEFQLLEK